MIGLDTNILLRAILDDDPVQSPAAQDLLRSLDGERVGFVNISVLMELFWVLRSRYRLPQGRLAGTIRRLFEVKSLEFEAFETLGSALAAYEAGIADFADAVIGLRNLELGAEPTFTFDRGAANSVAGMKLLA